MTNGWTRGQYAIYRILLGAYLLWCFLSLLPLRAVLFPSDAPLLMHHAPWLANVFAFIRSPLWMGGWLVAGAVAAAALMAGKFDRAAALVILYIGICLARESPLINDRSLVFLGFVLIIHALTPARPVLPSAEPGDDSPFPRAAYLAVWVLLALIYIYSAIHGTHNDQWMDGSALREAVSATFSGRMRDLAQALPAWCFVLAVWSTLALQITFALLLLSRRARPWTWGAMTIAQISFMAVGAGHHAGFSPSLLLLHLLAFDPAWGPKPMAAGEYILYDGDCALCHGFVKFVLQEDRSANPFHFAPLQGLYAARTIPEKTRATLPDSVVLLDPQGRIVVEADAVIYVGKRLGGLWRIAARLFQLVPRPLRNLGYSMIASVRKKIFGTTEQMCPIVPPAWRDRFDP